MKKLIVLIIVFFILNLISFIQIFQNSESLSNLEKQEAVLIGEKESLLAQLAQNDSLTEIRKKAEAQGMIRISNIVYLNKLSSIAKLP